MKRDEKLLLVFFALAGIGAWLYFSRAGRALTQSAGSEIATQVATGVEKVSDIGDSTLNLIKGFELFRSAPYRDARGWSIGYGHFMGAQPTIQYMSEADAYDVLKNDVQTAADAIRASVNVDLNQNQFDALTSLAYNIGVSAFTGSTLVRLLNGGNYDGAAAQFARWRMSQGRINTALVARRDREANLFVS